MPQHIVTRYGDLRSPIWHDADARAHGVRDSGCGQGHGGAQGEIESVELHRSVPAHLIVVGRAEGCAVQYSLGQTHGKCTPTNFGQPFFHHQQHNDIEMNCKWLCDFDSHMGSQVMVPTCWAKACMLAPRV